MQAGFHDARDRHWHDAESLRADGRWANADHLYGLAAECGLKRLMQAFGMRLRGDGKPSDDRDAKHADQIWVRYDAYRTGHPVGIAYALAAPANPFSDWNASQRYAKQGERVMVLDLDVESPGLSSSLLSADRRPAHGIADWLVEDLVDNGDFVIGNMVATSDLSREGDIAVVPAHGGEPGEYLAKLGRAWMPKISPEGKREAWPKRLSRLIGRLEAIHKPDVVLIDSRSGIDETASVCLTGLGASLILLFALEGDQTWSGYRMIFRNWLKTGVARSIRTRLQVVGAMVPELGGPDYLERLRDNAWEVFFTELYDEIPPGDPASLDDQWSFDRPA